jgi:alkylation response protein AidB-like acyl-CoA dehydrogenase
MTAASTADLAELRATVRRFLSARGSSANLRESIASESGHDRAGWQQLTGQLGLTALAIPEEFGGMGFGFTALAVVLEEMGRRLWGGPFFASAVVATHVLLACDDDQAKAEILPHLASGEQIATLALASPAGSWTATSVAATQASGGWRLNGDASFIMNVNVADLLLVFAMTDQGEQLFAVDAGASGVAVEMLPALDPTRRLGRLALSDVPARPVASPGSGAVIRTALNDIVAAGLACELVGLAASCVEMSVRYAQERYQFGRPIGSFQALKHICADMLVTSEAAHSLAFAAAESLHHGAPDTSLLASLAKGFCGTSAFDVAAATIQVHGGMGFTQEHDAHLYYKRAKSSQLFLGDESVHRERVIQLLESEGNLES